jgi:hypothetical protein
MHLSSTIALTALLAVAFPTAAQFPDSIPTARADSFSGLYRSANGHYFHLLNLADQLNNRSMLSLTKFANKKLRTLFPITSDDFEIDSE